jgi:hypothetical protein
LHDRFQDSFIGGQRPVLPERRGGRARTGHGNENASEESRCYDSGQGRAGGGCYNGGGDYDYGNRRGVSDSEICGSDDDSGGTGGDRNEDGAGCGGNGRLLFKFAGV